MPNFRSVVNKVIEKSDIVLEILDARFIDETRNHNLEKRVKILVHVLNKCDFVNKRVLEKAKRHLNNCVFVSATKRLGITLLREKIIVLARKNKIKNPLVGVIGYPNVGKSSIINALKGRRSARTSAEAGQTRGEQYLRVRNEFFMMDTPGIIGRNKKDLVLIGAKNPHCIKDPDLAVIKLLNEHNGLIERKYGVKLKKDKEATIKDIALKLNLKKKGGLPDIDRASRRILQDWLSG